MKKQHKRLIILIAVFVVLISGYLILDASLKEKEEIAAAGVTLTELEKSDLATISWTYGEESAVFVNDGTDTWTVQGDESFPLNQAFPRRMSKVLRGLTASRVVEDPTDEMIVDYGLNPPVFALEVTKTDGTSYTVDIGNHNEKDNIFYAFFDGDHENVYFLTTSDIESAFAHTLDELMTTDKVPSIEWINDYNISSTQHDMDWDIYYVPKSTTDEKSNTLETADEPSWFTKSASGKEVPVEPIEYANALATHFANLWLIECADWDVTEEDLETYGLVDPVYEITVNYTETELVDTGEEDEFGISIREEVKEDKTFVIQLGHSNELGTYTALPGITDRVYITHMEIKDLIQLIEDGTALDQ